MSLSRCTECETIEGGWREPTEAELRKFDFDSADRVQVCCECDGVDTYEGIPEHDDYDLER